MDRRLLAVAALTVAAAILVSLSVAALLYQARIPASGTMKAVGLEVYEDAACTIKLENIDWGLVAQGESKSVTCYMKSGSNVEAELFLTRRFGCWCSCCCRADFACGRGYFGR